MLANHLKRRGATLLVLVMLFQLLGAVGSFAQAAETYYTRCNAHLRASAESSSKSRSIIPGGEQVSVTGRSGEWMKVSYMGSSGYIRSDLLVQMTRSGYIPLANGDESPQVKELQARLRDLGYVDSRPDGKFGDTTEEAVYAFQKQNRLDADGIAGGQTQLLMYSNDAKASDGSRSSSSGGSSSNSSGNSTPKPTASTVLKKDAKGSEVKNMQARLRELGYITFSPDGVFGSGTEKGVVAFQKANGLKADGIVGDSTLSKLYSSSARATASATATPGTTGSDVFKRGDSGTEIKNMQARLKELGYITFSPDGEFGSGTRNAVIAFQKANRLSSDGIVGASTLSTLYSSSAIAKASSSGGSSSSSAPRGSDVQFMHWFDVVKKRYKAGQVITVYDPASKTSWKIRFMSMGRHADSEPLTASDTATMNSAFGNTTTWTPKAVWIKFPDGAWSMATMHNTPHLSGTIKDNNFDGHLCIHFLRNMDEVSKNDPSYGVQNQKVLRAAWKALTGQTVD